MSAIISCRRTLSVSFKKKMSKRANKKSDDGDEPLFTGASAVRITPDLNELRKRFALNQKSTPTAADEDSQERNQTKASSRVVEKTAKSRPVFHATSVVEELVKKNRPAHTRKAQDPRLSAAYGTFDPTFFASQYKHVGEQQELEQKDRLFRLKKLRVVLRHRDLERQKADLDEMGVIAEEQEVFEGAEVELGNMLRTPYGDLKHEMEQLKQLSAAHKSRVAQAATAQRAKDARKAVLKGEVDAVKSGKKHKPFIPSRSVIKSKVEEARYDHLVEKGGVQQAAKFIEKKRKKKQRLE